MPEIVTLACDVCGNTEGARRYTIAEDDRDATQIILCASDAGTLSVTAAWRRGTPTAIGLPPRRNTRKAGGLRDEDLLPLHRY